MKHVLWHTVLIAGLTLWFLGTPVGAQQATKKTAPKAGADESNVEEKALSVFNKMATFLS